MLVAALDFTHASSHAAGTAWPGDPGGYLASVIGPLSGGSAGVRSASQVVLRTEGAAPAEASPGVSVRGQAAVFPVRNHVGCGRGTGGCRVVRLTGWPSGTVQRLAC